MIFMGWCAARLRATVADGSCDLCIMCEDCKGDAELLGGHGGDATVTLRPGWAMNDFLDETVNAAAACVQPNFSPLIGCVLLVEILARAVRPEKREYYNGKFSAARAPAPRAAGVLARTRSCA